MRSLTLSLGALMTTFVALLWACAHSTGPPLVITAAHPPAVPDVPYTPDANAPRPGTRLPRYHVMLLPDAAPEPTGYPDVPAALRHQRFPPLKDGDYNMSLHPMPLAVNRHGEVVGYYGGGDSGAWLIILARPFFRQQGGCLRFLPTLPKYQITHAVALNDSGEIVGDARIDSFPGDTGVPSHAVCWLRGKVHDLGTGAAAAINCAGEIVGDSGTGFADYPHPAHALLWTHGYRYDLNDCLPPHSGWVLASGSAIDGKGRIVGYSLFRGKKRAFLLTPKL